MSPFSSFPDWLAPEVLTRELDAGEQVLWVGQPDPRRMFKRALPVMFVSSLGVAFFLFWTIGVTMLVLSPESRANQPTLSLMDFVFPAVGLLYTAVAAIGVAWPWLARSAARHTFYALTNKRALIVGESGGRARSVLAIHFLLERRDHTDGTGDLILRRGEERRRGTNKRIFYGVPHVREVERIAHELTQLPRSSSLK